MTRAVTANEMISLANAQWAAMEIGIPADVMDTEATNAKIIVIDSIREAYDLRYEHCALHESVANARAEGQEIPQDAERILATLGSAVLTYSEGSLHGRVVEATQSDALHAEAYRRLHEYSTSMSGDLEPVLREIYGDTLIEVSTHCNRAGLDDFGYMTATIALSKGAPKLNQRDLDQLSIRLEPIVTKAVGRKMLVTASPEKPRRMFLRGMVHGGLYQTEFGVSGSWFERQLDKLLSPIINPRKEIRLQDELCLDFDLMD